MLERPILCAFGLTEPDAGSDVARLKSTAVRKGDEYVLNGSKTFITGAGHAEWTVVFAKTDPEQGHRGISAFVVPMDTPGVTIERHLDKMGQRATETSAFSLHDVVVPGREPDRRGGRRLQDRDADARRHAARHGDRRGRRRAGGLRVRRATTRSSASRSTQPIAMHQGVNFLIADMATKIEAARLLTWQAAWMLDHG